MATPYISGVAALYVSKYGGRSTHGPEFAKQLTSRILSSGGSLPWQVVEPDYLPTDFGFWAPPAQVGTGLVNASKVLDYETTLSLEKFALNDTGHFSRYHGVDITNHGSKPVTYTFTLQPAGSFNIQSMYYADYVATSDELQPFSIVPGVSFPKAPFTVQPGETKTAKINFSPQPAWTRP